MCVCVRRLISVARCSLLLELKATGGVTVEREALMSRTCVCVCRAEFPTLAGNSIFEVDRALCRSFRTRRELRMASRHNLKLKGGKNIKGGKTFFIELDGIFKPAAVPSRVVTRKPVGRCREVPGPPAVCQAVEDHLYPALTAALKCQRGRVDVIEPRSR